MITKCMLPDKPCICKTGWNEVAIFEILGIDGRALAQYRVAASQKHEFRCKRREFIW